MGNNQLEEDEDLFVTLTLEDDSEVDCLVVSIFEAEGRDYIVWTIVNILVLYAIFRKFLFQPVLKVIQDRENIIKDQIDNAQKVTDDANQLKTDYEKKLEVVKEEADKIIVEARQRSEKERAKAIETTQQETQDMMERARGNIEREQENARKAVQADIARLAIAAAEKIVKTGDRSDNTSSK